MYCYTCTNCRNQILLAYQYLLLLGFVICSVGGFLLDKHNQVIFLRSRKIIERVKSFFILFHVFYLLILVTTLILTFGKIILRVEVSFTPIQITICSKQQYFKTNYAYLFYELHLNRFGFTYIETSNCLTHHIFRSICFFTLKKV